MLAMESPISARKLHEALGRPGGYVAGQDLPIADAQGKSVPRASSLPGVCRKDGGYGVKRGIQLPSMDYGTGREHTLTDESQMTKLSVYLTSLPSFASLSTSASGSPSPRAECAEFPGLTQNVGCSGHPLSPKSPCSPIGTPSRRRSHSLSGTGRLSSKSQESEFEFQTPVLSPSQLWMKRKGSKTRVKLAPLVQTDLPVGCSPRLELSQPQQHRPHIKFLDENEKIFDRYYWEEVLQEDGDGGKVVVCRSKTEHASAGFDCVMKIRSKETLRQRQPGFEEGFRKAQEQLLNLAQHAGVMPLKEVLEDSSFYYIVMHKANGGSFLESLVEEFKDGVVPVESIQKVMREILEAVRHVHEQGLLHRDIKPDNLVMQVSDDGSRKVMLIDFDHADVGHSRSARGERYTEDVFGTLRFNAPETFQGAYSTKSDLWSVGVILYLLMTGKMPYSDSIFDEETETGVCPATPKFSWKKAIIHELRSHPIDWECDPWEQQPVCKDLCMRLLAFKAKDRIGSASEALSHLWF